MTIDEALILKLEKLARLKLSADEREHLRKDLEDILAMVEKLDEVDTTEVEPLIHMTDVHSVLREDEVKGQLDQAEALRNAPNKVDTYFTVPKVIKRT